MKGDVLLIDFPFSHGSGSKVRPVLSVQGDNVQSVNTIIAQITSNLGRTGPPTRLLIDIAVETRSGLLSNSESTLTRLGSPTKPSGRFRVLRPHAQGGLGAVSVALDEELRREAAPKEIPERFASEESRGACTAELICE